MESTFPKFYLNGINVSVRSRLPLNARFHSGGSEYVPRGIQPCEWTFPLWRFGLSSAGASIPPRARLLLPSERLDISQNCTGVLRRCACERNCARMFRENRESTLLVSLSGPCCLDNLSVALLDFDSNGFPILPRWKVCTDSRTLQNK